MNVATAAANEMIRRLRKFNTDALAVRRAVAFWQDSVAIGMFVTIGLLLYRNMFTGGDYLPLPYGDWIAHAYRIRFIKEHGIASWDHNWAGGISLFQSYQIVPQVLTAIFSALTNASVGRSMLVLEGCLLVSISVSGYVATRILRLAPVAALLAGTIALGLNNYASPTTSFSALWGLAFAPLLLAAIFRYRESPLVYPIAAVCGFGVYVHPHLAEYGALGLLSATLIQAPTIRQFARLGLQALCFVLAAAFYWAPSLYSTRPQFEDQYSASGYFMRLLFHGELVNFSPLKWLFLVGVPVSTILLWRFVDRPLARYAFVVLALLVLLIALSYFSVGPESFRIAQNVRLLIFLPLVLGLLAAISGDALLSAAARFRYGRLLATMTLAGVAIIVALPLIRFADRRTYGPAWFGPDPLNDWLSAHSNEVQGRIWLDDLEAPWYSYRQFDQFRTSESHFPVGEWSILRAPMDDGMLSGQGFDVTEQYLKAMAVSHIVLPYFKPLEVNLAEGGSLSGRLVPVQRLSSSIIYKTPWNPVSAFLTDAAGRPEFKFPNHISNQPREHEILDPLVERYDALAYSDASSPVNVDYPSPTTMRVRLGSLSAGKFLVISENWDSSWRARTGDGGSISVSRYGPNFIGVDLSKVSGDIVVTLEHETSEDWKLGISFMLASIPVSLAFAIAELLVRGRHASEDAEQSS